ncbi:MAG: ABC transporter ATP-binding protein [Kiloniellales bacterium]
MTARVEIRGVTQRFGSVTALKGIDVAVEAGRFAVLLGPSGCGKTTLLSILGGFLTPSEGRVLIGGRDVTFLPPARRPTTTMFQDYALFPHMSLGANVGFGLRMRGMARAPRDVRARELLALVGLEGAFHRKPHELSGGQRQRVALARALAVEPDVLLLDEPLGALDLKLRRQMQDELKAIQRRVGTTFIHVTHDQEEAMAIADEIIVMNHGVIEDYGPPERVYLRPRSAFAAGFMGEINMLDGSVEAVGDEAVTVATPLGRLALPAASFGGLAPTLGLAVKLGVRPEHIRPDLDPAGALDLGQAEIADEAFFGTHHRCHLRLQSEPDCVFTAHLPQTAGIAVGDLVALRVAPGSVIVLAGSKR